MAPLLKYGCRLHFIFNFEFLDTENLINFRDDDLLVKTIKLNFNTKYQGIWLILIPLLTIWHWVRDNLNYLIHVHAHNIYKLLFFQTLSLPYKHIHYTLVHGIYTYFSLTWNWRRIYVKIKKKHETAQKILS